MPNKPSPTVQTIAVLPTHLLQHDDMAWVDDKLMKVVSVDGIAITVRESHWHEGLLERTDAWLSKTVFKKMP